MKLNFFLILFLLSGSIYAQKKKELKRDVILYKDSVYNLKSQINFTSQQLIERNKEIIDLENEISDNLLELADNKELIEKKNKLIVDYQLRYDELILLNDSINDKLDSLTYYQSSAYEQLLENNESLTSLFSTYTDSSVWGSQSNFLYDLLKGNEEINNQTLQLKFAGTYNISQQKEYDEYGNYNYENLYIPHIYMNDELRFTTKYYTNGIKYDLSYKECISLVEGKRKKYSYLTLPKKTFPTFSFVKGKVLTISNSHSTSTSDYSFSSSYEKNEKNSFLQFKLRSTTNSKLINLTTIVIKNNVYLLLTNGIMNDLGFDIKFTNDFKESNSWSFYDSNKRTCNCDRTYINLSHNPLASSQFNIRETLHFEKSVYLFELIKE